MIIVFASLRAKQVSKKKKMNGKGGFRVVKIFFTIYLSFFRFISIDQVTFIILKFPSQFLNYVNAFLRNLIPNVILNFTIVPFAIEQTVIAVITIVN